MSHDNVKFANQAEVPEEVNNSIKQALSDLDLPDKERDEMANGIAHAMVAFTMVMDGGVFWKCDECGNQGVFGGGTEIAQDARETTGIKAPRPLGLELLNGCPVCNPNPTKKEEKGAPRTDNVC